jgi:hypothetical protein
LVLRRIPTLAGADEKSENLKVDEDEPFGTHFSIPLASEFHLRNALFILDSSKSRPSTFRFLENSSLFS